MHQHCYKKQTDRTRNYKNKNLLIQLNPTNAERKHALIAIHKTNKINVI